MANDLQKKRKSPMSDSERIRDFQRKLYRKAKQDKDFRFYVLYDKVRSLRFLRVAYNRVRANKGAPGVDNVTFEEIESYGVDKYLTEIHDELDAKSYKPSPVKRVYIPKANGDKRPLGIPTIKDRIVQMSCKIVIEPIFEADFENSSYGFRPKRSAKQAVTVVKEHLKSGKTDVLDADLSSYFDNIPHDKLLILIGLRISDGNVIHLIKMWLKAPIIEDGKPKGGKSNKRGTPQGGVISPLLANIYLHLVDRMINKVGGMFHEMGVKIVRYADDFVLMAEYIPCHLLEKLENVLTRMGLTLNQEKTKQLNARDESFDFLGFTFRYDRSRFDYRKRYWNVIPSEKSEKKLRKKLADYFCGRRHYPNQAFVNGLNIIICGWVNYFNIPKVSYPNRSLSGIRWYLGEKLYRHYRGKSQRSSKQYGRDGYKRLVNQYGLVEPCKLLTR